MSGNFDDLSNKPCRCGDVMGQIIGYDHRPEDDTYQRYRVGWYCVNCHAFEQAILRERQVELE